jgi:hypothetical protein
MRSFSILQFDACHPQTTALSQFTPSVR